MPSSPNQIRRWLTCSSSLCTLADRRSKARNLLSACGASDKDQSMRVAGRPTSSAMLSSRGAENEVFQRVEGGQETLPGFGICLSKSTNSIIPLLAPCCSFNSRRTKAIYRTTICSLMAEQAISLARGKLNKAY